MLKHVLHEDLDPPDLLDKRNMRGKDCSQFTSQNLNKRNMWVVG